MVALARRPRVRITAVLDAGLVRRSGYVPPMAPRYCLLTRVEMRHWWDVVAAFFMYLRLRREPAPGLQRTAYAVETPHVFHTISIWESESAMTLFGGSEAHVAIVRWTFRKARGIWASEWQLVGVSGRHAWSGAVPGFERMTRAAS